MPDEHKSFQLGSCLTPGRIIDLASATKADALRELVDVLRDAPEVTDPEGFYQAIIDREKIMSTGLGIGIALPHVKIPSITNFVTALGRKRDGLDFDSLDGKPAKIVIMIGASEKQHRDFLKVIARISHLLRQEKVREEILAAEGPEAILDVIRQHEQAV
ncbi:MAG: PTS sugar transporter subunit IIA [bacterium]